MEGGKIDHPNLFLKKTPQVGIMLKAIYQPVVHEFRQGYIFFN